MYQYKYPFTLVLEDLRGKYGGTSRSFVDSDKESGQGFSGKTETQSLSRYRYKSF